MILLGTVIQGRRLQFIWLQSTQNLWRIANTISCNQIILKPQLGNLRQALSKGKTPLVQFLIIGFLCQVPTWYRFYLVWNSRLAVLHLCYFFDTMLCGLRLPIRPLSVPAPLSITAFTNVGFPESIASLTARPNSSGDVTFTPMPPNASIILS